MGSTGAPKTTTLPSARAPNHSCSWVHSICGRLPARPPPVCIRSVLRLTLFFVLLLICHSVHALNTLLRLHPCINARTRDCGALTASACARCLLEPHLIPLSPAVVKSCPNPRTHKVEVHYRQGTLVESRPCWPVVPLPTPSVPPTRSDEHFSDPDSDSFSDSDSFCHSPSLSLPHLSLYSHPSALPASPLSIPRQFMSRSLQSTLGTTPSFWHTRPSSGDALECDADLYAHFLSTGKLWPPPALPISDTLPHMQAEMTRFGHYTILVSDNASLLVSATLGELNSLGCPGREYHTGLLHIGTNAINAAANLHNDNLNTSLPEEVHTSLKAYLSDATNSLLHDEVTQHLLFPPFNLLVPGMGVEQYGSQQVDNYTHAHIHCVHTKLCEVFGETPLPVTGPPGFLTKGIAFSPFMRIMWPDLGDLKCLNGSKKPPKPRSYRSICHQSRKDPFQPETKDFGNSRVYFTVHRRPFPIAIHYNQVPDFSQFAEATPINIQSLVKSVGDFELKLTNADQSLTKFISLPMVQLDPLLSFMSLDCCTSFPPHLFPTPQSPSPLYSLSPCTPLHTLKVTYGFPVLSTIPLPPFLRDVPARHIPYLTLTRPHPTNQADTSYQGEAGRWVQLIKYKPHVGNNWSTAPITAAEKGRTLFPATVNEVYQQMMYSKVPTPHGGFASIFPCTTLHCCGKKPRDASDDGDSKTVSGVPHASLPTFGATNPNTFNKFIGNAFTYKYYNTILWTSVDTRANMVMGCPNKCTVSNDCVRISSSLHSLPRPMLTPRMSLSLAPAELPSACSV